MQTEQDALESSAEALPDAPAESSPADEVEADVESGSPLDDIFDAVENAEPEEAAAPEDAESEADAEDPDGDKKDEDLPFHQHPRFQELIGERRELKEKVEALEPKVRDYDNIQNFLQTNNIEAQEAAEALQIAAAIKSDPEQAFNMLRPVFESVARQAGYLPPAELAEQVKQGRMTREQALEQSRRVAQERHRETQLSQREQRLQQEETQRQQQQIIQAANQVVTTWEQDVRAKDPDFDKKTDLIQARLTQVTTQNGPPRTASEAQERLSSAYNWATNYVRSVQPQKPPSQPRPNKRPSKPTMQRAPKGIEDIFDSILGASS